MAPVHGATRPSSRHERTIRANRGSRAVKYWAPWSKRRWSARLVDMRPPGPRALSKTWRAGDEILVTRLDHDADVSPWVMAARDTGAVVRHVEVRPDCTLDLGDLLVKWIVTQAPHHRRAVFVLKGDSADATNARVQSVQMAVNKYAGGCAIPVLLTDTEPAGWSAAYIDTITQQFNATIPAPRLPQTSTTGGQGSSGGGGNQ